VLLPEQNQPPENSPPRKRGDSFTASLSTTAPVEIPTTHNATRASRGRFSRPASHLTSVDTKSAGAYNPKDITLSPQVSRRISSPDQVPALSYSGSFQKGVVPPISASRTGRVNHTRDESQERISDGLETRRPSIASPSATFSSLSTYSFQTVPKASNAIIQRTRLSRSPSQQNLFQVQSSSSTPPVPLELLPLLDGEHHTDELATRFETGWPLLEQWLVTAGGGKGDGDFGRVSIIYR